MANDARTGRLMANERIAELIAEVRELRTVLAKVSDDQCGCLGGPLTIEWATGKPIPTTEQRLMANEQICPSCRHARRVHSREGCGEIIDMRTGRECSCRRKYMDGGWVMGEPKIG